MGKLLDAMTDCIIFGPVLGQVVALLVMAFIVFAALIIAARLLGSRLTAPVLIVGLAVGTGVTVYVVGSMFAVFENDKGILNTSGSTHSNCERSFDERDARVGLSEIAALARAGAR